MSPWRLHMSDVENEKSEGLAYTQVFKGKHTFQNAHKSNPPGGLTHTRWPYCHRAMPSGVAMAGSAGSRNLGPRPLGAPPTVSLVRQAVNTCHSCKTQVQ